MNLANELETNGVTVVNTDVFSNPKCREELIQEADKFPEFLPGVDKKILGGFGAYGNPASFHNPTVRMFREWAMAIVIDKLFRYVLADRPDNWKLEQKIERMTIREPGEQPSAEVWHRDLNNITTTPSDEVFGGWINLDDSPQYFSCVLGSHRTGTTTAEGFVRVTKEEAKRVKDLNLSTMVKIPPGGILVFHENIIHEVLGKKLPRRMVRLHTAWRLTPGEARMEDGLLRKLDQQGIITIKSGQEPPMFAKLHWTNWTDKLQKWSVETMQPRCTEVRIMKSGKRKGECFTVVNRHMGSLEYYGFPKYPKYSDEEKNILFPGREFSLLIPGKKRLRMTYGV